MGFQQFGSCEEHLLLRAGHIGDQEVEQPRRETDRDANSHGVQRRWRKSRERDDGPGIDKAGMCGMRFGGVGDLRQPHHRVGLTLGQVRQPPRDQRLPRAVEQYRCQPR